jgi:tRNA A-37 threonylcarbamoyl transferase component Bud32
VTAHAVRAASELKTLVAATENALAASPEQRTVVVHHEGSSYVAKRLAERPRRLIQTLFMRWLVKRITGLPLPLRTLALSEAAGSMEYEARRLRSLAEAGAAVPEIMYRTPDYLLLEHRGTVVASLLENWTADIWRLELPRMATDLGMLHAKGLWHGGAQIKNVTLENGQFTRIDFEENFGEFLPLPVTQATDLLLFLNSVSLSGPLDEAESRHLLPELLAAYLQANPNHTGILDTLRRAQPWFHRIVCLVKPFQRYTRKSYLRMVILVDALDTLLKRP